MSTLIPLLVLLALGLFPFSFIFIITVKGKPIISSLSFAFTLYRWRYQIPVLEREGFNTVHQKRWNQEWMNGEEIKVEKAESGPTLFLASLAQIGGAIKNTAWEELSSIIFLPKLPQVGYGYGKTGKEGLF